MIEILGYSTSIIRLAGAIVTLLGGMYLIFLFFESGLTKADRLRALRQEKVKEELKFKHHRIETFSIPAPKH